MEKPSKPSWFNLVLIIAAALVGIAYWNAPQNGFVYDDQWQVVRNPLIQQPGLWTKAITSDVWAFRTGDEAAVSNYYRPVFTAWSIANFALFQLDPTGWHVANILLHLCAVWLVLRVLIELGFHPIVCAAATWIFAAHPAHVENVTWIAGSPDLLMTIFLMASMLAYLRVRQQPSAKAWTLALLSMALALGSKESALMFVFVIFAAELVLSKQESRDSPMARAMRGAAAYALVALAFFILRRIVLGQALIGSQQEISFGSILLTLPSLISFYLVQGLAPFNLSSAYPLRAVAPGELTAANFIIPLAITVAVLAAAILLVRRHGRLGSALAIAGVLAPSLYIKAFHYEHIVRDRYIYLPLLGLWLLVLVPLAKIGEHRDTFEWKPLTIGALAVALVMAYASMQYNPVWKDDVTLWQRGVATDPNGSMAHMQLAEALRTSGKADEALPISKRAVELGHNAKTLNVLGLCYKDLGDFPKAIETFEEVIAAGSETGLAAGQLADIYSKQGEFEKAIAAFEGEIRRNPGYEPLGKQNIAVLQVRAGHREEAIETLESSLESAKRNSLPNVKRSWFMLAELYYEKGMNVKAVENYRTYLEQTEGMTDSQTEQNRSRAAQMVSELGD